MRKRVLSPKSRIQRIPPGLAKGSGHKGPYAPLSYAPPACHGCVGEESPEHTIGHATHLYNLFLCPQEEPQLRYRGKICDYETAYFCLQAQAETLWALLTWFSRIPQANQVLSRFVHLYRGNSPCPDWALMLCVMWHLDFLDWHFKIYRHIFLRKINSWWRYLDTVVTAAKGTFPFPKHKTRGDVPGYQKPSHHIIPSISWGNSMLTFCCKLYSKDYSRTPLLQYTGVIYLQAGVIYLQACSFGT